MTGWPGFDGVVFLREWRDALGAGSTYHITRFDLGGHRCHVGRGSERQNRALDAIYLGFFDAIRIKIRDEGFVQRGPFHIVLSTLLEDSKEFFFVFPQSVRRITS